MPADQIKYLDFDLRISGTGGLYSAHVYASPGGQATNNFTIPLSQDRLELLILRLSRIRSATRGGIDTPELAAARELGGVLFHAVFQGGVRDVLRSSLEKYRQQPNTGLRLKLRLQDAPELANLPWEFLYDENLRRFLAQSTYTPIVRYIELPESIPPLRTALPLRILGMVAAPNDCVHLDVCREQSLIEQALEPLIQAGQVEITWLNKATLTSLRRYLRAGEYHIFHFIGHGGFDIQKEQGILLFEDDNGHSTRVDAERLGVLLHDHRNLRLAVLNACEGARNTPSDPFTGVATTLAQQGLPAVEAMQFAISDKAAITFAGEFYSSLAQGFPVDAAMAEARKAIFAEVSDVEWGTPVLFLRASDGVLFDMDPEMLFSAHGNVISGVDDIKSIQEEKGNEEENVPFDINSTNKEPVVHSGPHGSSIKKSRFIGDLFYLPNEPLLGFVEIPAGPFLMGSNLKVDVNASKEELPQHIVDLPLYYIGRYPVTVHQFFEFVASSEYKYGGTYQGQDPESPMVNVNWNDALVYCLWLQNSLTPYHVEAGKMRDLLENGVQITLPSEAQWEKAARGNDGRIYPWGNRPPERDFCNIDQWYENTTPVGKFSPKGDSPYGCVDMAGNCWEWTSSIFERYPYALTKGRDDLSVTENRVLRGGCYYLPEPAARCANRSVEKQTMSFDGSGFRVVLLPSKR